MQGRCAAAPGAELGALLKQVDGWNVVAEHHITKKFAFPDFQKTLDFVNKVGAIAEEQGHPPDIYLDWAKSRSRSGRTR